MSEQEKMKNGAASLSSLEGGRIYRLSPSDENRASPERLFPPKPAWIRILFMKTELPRQSGPGTVDFGAAHQRWLSFQI